MKRKKHFYLLTYLFLFFVLFGCAPKHITVKDTANNINIFEELIQDISYKYGYFTVSEKHQDMREINIVINIKENERIEISIWNDAETDKKGVERFCVDYIKEDSTKLNEFNLDFFLELIGCISKKTVTKNFCNDFLNAPESEYAASDYGYLNAAGDLIAKQHPINWGEDWVITYNLTADGTEILGFGGWTVNCQ